MSVDGERLDAMNDAIEILDLYAMGKIRISPHKSPAVVFDIDDTLIDSETEERIEPMYLLYKKVQRMGLTIFLITARSKTYLSETKEELGKHGLTGYRTLFMVDNDIRIISKYPSVYREDKAMRKAKARKIIEDSGYDILLNIGDDPGDMQYNHYIYGIKLPYLY